MKSRLFLILAIILAASVSFIACSDNSTEPELTEGDYDDPNYQTARLITDSVVDTVIMEADAASDFIGFDGSEPMRTAGDSLLIAFDELTCWWHLYLSADTTNSSLPPRTPACFLSIRLNSRMPRDASNSLIP
jgi:hypothetical protein